MKWKLLCKNIVVIVFYINRIEKIREETLLIASVFQHVQLANRLDNVEKNLVSKNNQIKKADVKTSASLISIIYFIITVLQRWKLEVRGFLQRFQKKLLGLLLMI